MYETVNLLWDWSSFLCLSMIPMYQSKYETYTHLQPKINTWKHSSEKSIGCVETIKQMSFQNIADPPHSVRCTGFFFVFVTFEGKERSCENIYRKG